MSRRRQAFLSFLGIAASGLGAFLLYRVVKRYDMAEIGAAMASVSMTTVALALLFTLIGYGFLAGCEYLAVRYAGQRMSLPRVAFTAAAALGIGHSIGLAALSSGAVRLRMYGRVGADLAAVGRVVAFAGVTVALSMGLVGGLAILWHSEQLGEATSVSPLILKSVAYLAFALVLAYLVLCRFRTGDFAVRRFRIKVPSLGMALAQLVCGAGHLLSVSAVLYVAVRNFTDADYATLAALYVGADLSALVGHVPGGWGVIEYIVTSALEGPQLLAGLIIFRVTYYLVPLAVGVTILIVDELSSRRIVQRGLQPSSPSYRR